MFSQGLVKGAILCFSNPYFYFRHGESTSTVCQLTSPASQKSKDLNKVQLLLQDLAPTNDKVKLVDHSILGQAMIIVISKIQKHVSNNCKIGILETED